MKKIYIKIYIRVFGIIFITSFCSLLFNRQIDKDKFNMTSHIFSLIFPIITLFLFGLAIELLIIKRIRSLSQATIEVAKGNYDVKVACHGVDEISKLIGNFNAMIDELKTNQYLSKSFTRNVSHEFKTPISTILGFSESIEEISQDQTVTQYATIIKNEALRMEKLTRMLLLLAKIDSTNLIELNDNVKIATQIRTIIVNMQHEWEAKNIEFDLMLDEGYFQSNEHLLYQVWQNLISNAIKFSKQGGIIKIRLVIDTKIHLTISDEGQGINEDDKAKIFNTFFTADKARDSNSHGLGLAITMSIIEKLNGHITFDSTKDIGTTFKVDI